MAPTKKTTTNRAVTSQAAMHALLPATRKGFARKAANSQNSVNDQNAENVQTRAKRKADNSPIKNEKIKRSALGNLTNNVKVMTINENGDTKNQIKKSTILTDVKNKLTTVASTAKHAIAPPTQINVVPQPQQQQQNQQQQQQQQQPPAFETKVMTRAATKNERNLEKLEEVVVERQKPKQEARKAAAPPPPAAPMVIPVLPLPKRNAKKPVRRISNEFNKTEESLYMSALENISSCESLRLSGNFEALRRRSAQLQLEKQQQQQKTDDTQTSVTAEGIIELQPPSESAYKPVPRGVDDFDKNNWDDPYQVSCYAMDIFNYMKSREKDFPIIDYMPKQIHLSNWMRTLLVDWMVEVQETFELNHETLYLAVKIVDRYLCCEVIAKEKLQLLGAAGLFIACKYDERMPPLIEDFLYICDGAYKHDELVRMEMETLRVIDCNLGIPISYRFLRRYARCAKVQMPTLTLARYILELSLMDYGVISLSDSQMAAAALFIALRMHNRNNKEPVWTPTLIYYSDYNLADFAEIVPILNAGLHRKLKGSIKTIRSKYSHKIFHEVAKVPLMGNDELFLYNLDINLTNTTPPLE